MIFNEMVSTKAAGTFQFCAWWTLFAAFLIVVILVFPSAYGRGGIGVAAAISVVGLIGSATSLILLVGMLLHLLNVGQRRPLAKLLWAVVIVFALPVGAVVYFFAVYKRQIASVSV